MACGAAGVVGTRVHGGARLGAGACGRSISYYDPGDTIEMLDDK
jgi:hypothetical protein